MTQENFKVRVQALCDDSNSARARHTLRWDREVSGALLADRNGDLLPVLDWLNRVALVVSLEHFLSHVDFVPQFTHLALEILVWNQAIAFVLLSHARHTVETVREKHAVEVVLDGHMFTGAPSFGLKRLNLAEVRVNQARRRIIRMVKLGLRVRNLSLGYLSALLLLA